MKRPLYTWRQIRANVERSNACHTPRVGGGADETGAGDGSQCASATGSDVSECEGRRSEMPVGL